MCLLLSKFIKVHPLDGMRESAILSRIYTSCNSYRVARWCLQQALKYETPFFSVTARKIMRERFGVEIGAYSYGPCFSPSVSGAPIVIGRYVSIGQGLKSYRANHPLDRLSTHAFFFNGDLGYVRDTNIEVSPLTIEHDVWIGDGVIITPRCRRIGLGAVVGAGSVVTKDVPDFAVVAGNPARVIKWRFNPEMQERVRQSKWWELPVGECVRHIDFMSSALAGDAWRHPLLNRRSAMPTVA